jgi:hypothetical protein
MRTFRTPSKSTITNKTRPAGSFSSSAACRCSMYTLYSICLFSGLVPGFLDSGPCCPIPLHKDVEIRFAFRVLVQFIEVIFTEVRDCKCMFWNFWCHAIAIMNNSEYEPNTLGSKDCCATHRVTTYSHGFITIMHCQF